MVLRRRHVPSSVLEGESRDNEGTKPVRDKQLVVQQVGGGRLIDKYDGRKTCFVERDRD